jgi:TonB family protein
MLGCVLSLESFAQSTPQIVRKTGDELLKEIVKWEEPQYPPIARQAGAGGPVVVELEIDEQGDVASARVVSGHPLLRAVTVKAALAWKFKPAKVNDVPVRLAGSITYTFPVADPLFNQKIIGELERQVQDNPVSAEARYELGAAYIELTRYGEAVLQLSAAIRINPRHAEAYLKLGHAYSHLRSPENALQAFREAARLNPDSSEAFHAIGLVHLQLGKYEEAMKAFKHSLEVEGPITTSYFLLGKCYVLLNRPAEAVAYYKQGLEKYAESDMGHFGLGEAYFALEQFGEAINEFKQAIKLSAGPGTSEARYSLGLSYLKAGDKDSALKEYEILKRFREDLAERLLEEIRISGKTKRL